MTAAPAAINAGYRNSNHTGSSKDRPFFKREEIQEFFETCPSDLVSHPELRTLHGMWIAAGKPFGSEIQFFKAMKHYRAAAPNGGYKSESTVRSNIRRAEDSGILEVAYRDRRGNCHHIWIRERNDSDRGLYRRVTTHRLSIPLLLQWRHRRVEPIRKPAQPDLPKPPAPAAPLPKRQEPAAEKQEHRGTTRITRDERTALFNAYLALKGSGMTHETALAEVLRQFKNKFSPDDVEFALKIVGHKNGRDVTAESPPEPKQEIRCRTCGDQRVITRQLTGPGQKRVIPCPDCSTNSS